MKLAVIPARGGSKRIPRKNIKPFLGKPMIGWAIEEAQASQCFDRIIVSTDDDEIASVARRFGVETPFRRPPELSDDHTGTKDVIAHAIQTEIDCGNIPTAVCCIYPTAALLKKEFLIQGLRALEQTDCDYAISVTRYAFPIQRAIRLNATGRIEMLYPEHEGCRSQELETSYHDAAQFYWGQTAAWLSKRSLFSAGTVPIVLPHYLAQDIDTIEDWIHAEFKFAQCTAGGHSIFRT